MSDGDPETVTVWLAERTYSEDEQNIIILTYATPDGTRYLRKERALTSFQAGRETRAGFEVDPERLAPVEDEELQERYATEATRIATERDLNDPI